MVVDRIKQKRNEMAAKAQEALRRAEASEHKASEYYERAGHCLKWLKENVPEHVTWKAYAWDKFRLSRERADELIRIAEGRATVDEMRSNTKTRVRQHRANKRKKRVLRNTRRGPAKARRAA